MHDDDDVNVNDDSDDEGKYGTHTTTLGLIILMAKSLVHVSRVRQSDEIKNLPPTPTHLPTLFFTSIQITQ